jgi:hypothetical protein
MAQPLRRRVRPYIFPFPTDLSAPTGRKDWSGLHPHDQVTVHEGKELPYEGVVDVLTDDATVMWVLSVRNGSRRAFHYSDDVDISKVS